MSSPPPNRRQFLTGRATAGALTVLADRAEESLGLWQADPSAQTYLVQFGRRAMACQFECFLNAGQYAAAGQVVLEALDLIDRLEDQLSVYRETSELTHVNRSAYEAPVPVEEQLFGLFQRALALHRETHAAFDITAGPLSKVWGFYRRAGSIPDEHDLAEALSHVGSRHLELDARQRTVRFLVPGMEINLGAIGKGYALDRAAELLLAGGVDDFLWHGGQSSVLARGSCAATAGGGGGWVVGLKHPLWPERPLAEIRLCNRALGTSGAGTQFFRHAGQRYGHILDPRSGRPAEGMYSTTVLAGTAADADALATALYTLGPEPALAWCRERPGIGLLMVVPGVAGKRVELLTAGLSGADFRLVDESIAIRGAD